ncbi:DUF2400 domain-containing protein [Alloscardovia macacae]|uniref:Uncharacterized protein n=1 Tax=Alloscardovia macacae TaxID=1160091 RepID=A0A261F4Q4_9BIFI|nr:DUF2400 domain-containing protein [Alloscardovia macacae]OZG54117.1 hypothetical protein ALMA_0578 [Alloscardovia macacae]
MANVKKDTDRVEEFDVTRDDGVDFHIWRNIDTGEQTVTRIEADN